MSSELPTILLILELDIYVESQDGRYSSFPKFSTMYVHVTYKYTSGTKTPLFLLKPMASVETSRVITDWNIAVMYMYVEREKKKKRE